MNFFLLFTYNGRTIIYLYLFKKKKMLWLVRSKLKKRGLFFSKNAKFGTNIMFPHPLNVVVGDGAVIGDNALIYHNVTIGNKNGKYPHIGNNVTIYPNSILVGDITVGDNCVIGAGSVVINNVPKNSIVGGNPAKIIKVVK